MSGQLSLPEQTETLIIGAGAVGCSVAYHLTKYGHEDVTVVDKGPIPETGGSSIHAPGGLFQTTGSKTMTRFAMETRDLYESLGAFDRIGGIEVATTDERWQFLKRRMDQATAWELNGAKLLTPSQVQEHIPLIDSDRILGGYYLPTDGRMKTIELLNKFRERSESRGATFHERTTVTDVETESSEVTAVNTDRGRIEVGEVLVAGNIWAPLIGDMVGVDIPLTPCAHQYAVTEELDALAGAGSAVEHPFLRHQDAAMYFRQHGEGYGIGSYNHRPILVDPEDIDNYEEAMEESPVYDFVPGRGSLHDAVKMPSTRPFTEEDFEPAWRETTELLPPLDGADIVKGYNGMFCFTPDGMPILGESPDVEDFWVAAAVWLTHAGGVGKAVAEWMATGTPEANVSGCDITRFQPHEASTSFVTARGYQQYDEVYDIVHPRTPSSNQRNLREAPFYRHQKDLDAVFYDSAGWERARYYESNDSLLDEYDMPSRTGWESQHWSPIEGAEHQAVRDRVGLFDLSNFTGIDVCGSSAAAFVQRIFANDMDVPVGKVTYTLMLNERGGVLGDMTVVRLGTNHYRVMASSGSAGTEQLEWLHKQAPDDDSVQLTNRVSTDTGVGVWGPEARKTLQRVTDTDLSNDAFPYFTAQEITVGSIPVLALRVSYVGELGWELHAPSEYGAKLWQTVWEAGQEHDITAMGDGALNTMRLEKGFRMSGADIHSEYNPYEANMGFAVDLDTNFVGKEALLDVRKAGADKQIACITLDQPGEVVTSGVPVLKGDTRLGYATSADYGYSVGSGIVYAYLPSEYTESETSVEVQYENERYPATVREEPLFDPEREKILS